MTATCDLVSLHSEAPAAILPGTPEFEQTVSMMAQEYAAATGEIRRCALAMAEQSERLRRIFGNGSCYDYEIGLEYHGRTRHHAQDIDAILELFKRQTWRLLVAKLGLFSIMSVKGRKEFERQLESGELPEINADAIAAILIGLADRVQDFAKEAAREVFEFLRPPRSGYKSNSVFRIGRRVILSWWVEPNYGGGWRTLYTREAEAIALDSVFHMLDGKGPIKDRQAPLLAAMAAAAEGKGETAYFKFRCFKNRNFHVEFKRLDLVRELNRLAIGQAVLGEDIDD